MRRLFAPLLICSALLVACASATTTARPMPTPSPTPTTARQPVVLAISATSQGTVAAKTLLLDTKVAISNNTEATISIIGGACDFRETPILLQLHVPSDPPGMFGWNNLEPTNSCPSPGEFDVESIPSGSTFVWREKDHPFYKLGLNVQAGVSYTLSARLWLWHQGDLSPIGTSSVSQGSDVTAQTTITFG